MATRKGVIVKTAFEMFLLAAEELNFSRAAERAYVTPQCLSDHIKRLEAHYHVKLFERRPHLRLTAEGAAMLRFLSRTQALELSLINELADISHGIRGVLRLGIPLTRGELLVPTLVPEFQKKYPNVDVRIRLNDTQKLEEMLLSGEIDLFLGVDAREHPLFDKEVIANEPLYLVIPEKLLKKYFGSRTEDKIRECYTSRIDLKGLSDIPLIMGYKNSTSTIAVENFLMKDHISASMPIQVSNFSITLDLCRSGNYSTFCSLAILRQLQRDEEKGHKFGDRLHIFRVNDLDKEMEISIVTHRDSQSLRYMTDFKELLKKYACREMQNAKLLVEKEQENYLKENS
jgi:DNA-binding transcriptional LysR family regulator